MRIIIEFLPKHKIWVLIPTVILFVKGSEGDYTDLTFAWLCFGISFRFGEHKGDYYEF